MKTPFGALLAGIFLMMITGCASTPAVPVPSGSRVIVRLYDAKGRIELALANETHPGFQEVYSHARADASLKLAPDELMGQLLASLDLNGFNAYATSGAAPGQGNVSYLAVDHDGEQVVFVEPPRSADIEKRRTFTMLKLLMTHYYTPVGSLQFVENTEGGGIFEATP